MQITEKESFLLYFAILLEHYKSETLKHFAAGGAVCGFKPKKNWYSGFKLPYKKLCLIAVTPRSYPHALKPRQGPQGPQGSQGPQRFDGGQLRVTESIGYKADQGHLRDDEDRDKHREG